MSAQWSRVVTLQRVHTVCWLTRCLIFSDSSACSVSTHTQTHVNVHVYINTYIYIQIPLYFLNELQSCRASSYTLCCRCCKRLAFDFDSAQLSALGRDWLQMSSSLFSMDVNPNAQLRDDAATIFYCQSTNRKSVILGKLLELVSKGNHLCAQPGPGERFHQTVVGGGVG